MFRFVHSADLHLDSPFRGISQRDEATGDLLRRATFGAFERLIDLCLNEQADFLLVAGDVYDGEDRSLRAQLAFRDGLTRLSEAGIPSFVVHGNHDPLEGWVDSIGWPEKVTVFGFEAAERVRVEIRGQARVEISGISYRDREEARALQKELEPGSSELFQIALLHANCGASSEHEPYVPCSPDEIAKAGFDYWALGHVHERRDWHQGARIVYPGNLQGRSIRETGPRGAVLVEVDDRDVSRLHFHALDAVRWQEAELAIGALDKLDQLDDALDQTLREVREASEDRPTLVRLRLTGSGPLHRELRRPGALEQLRERVHIHGLSSKPRVWLESLRDQTATTVELDQRRRQDDLLGHVLREADRLREDPEVLGSLLAPLFEDPRAGRWLEPFSEDRIGRLIEEAERLCVDLLEETE